ncbi:heterokaryon incompatibility protein-domain-containing protein, partial [Phaeosphaeria sp. MPI-PUGE-AT-0046c]
ATYACLSHCWGKTGAALQLRKTTFESLKHGVAVEKLPKTFREAMKICKELGIRFIWIDALCIMQDDAEDWQEAATSMANIYQNSIITIAATWSSDSNGGCFTSIKEPLQARKLGNTGLYVRVSLPDFSNYDFGTEHESENWPLLGRGWVLQERILSTRVVHYAKHQLFWECNTSFLSQDGLQDLEANDKYFYSKVGKTPAIPLKMSLADPTLSWRKIVCTYTGLQLTKTSDLLPALAGIVEQEMRRRKDDTYVAGMWKSTLLDDLAFYTEEGPRTGSTAPTWSWLSSKGRVYFTTFQKLPSLELVNLNFTSIGPVSLGQVSNASIIVRGPVLLV